MVSHRSRFGKSDMSRTFIIDNALFYVHDFKLPRQTKEGSLIFEPYWTPEFKIVDEDGLVYIRAQLTGFERDKLTVVVHSDMLLISGKRMIETEEEDAEFPRRKPSYGTFRRVIYLPRIIDQSKIQAFYKNGFLQIRLPKKEDGEFRSIHIRTE